MKNIKFGVNFVVENSNKLQKLGKEGKNQLSPQLFSHLGQWHNLHT